MAFEQKIPRNYYNFRFKKNANFIILRTKIQRKESGIYL